MLTNDEIKEHAKKMGYDGKITQYIRKKVIEDMEKGDTDNKDEELEKKVKKVSKKIPKKSNKKALKVINQVLSGVRKTSSYLSDCGKRYREYSVKEKPIKSSSKSRKNPTKSVKKSVIKTLKKKSAPTKKKRSVNRKSTKKPITAKSITKAQADLNKKLIKWM